MKLATREDIDAPIEAVFEQLSDFEGFERAIMRRGAEVQRIDDLKAPGPGMAWTTSFGFRGRRREARIDLAEHAHPDRLRAAVKTSGVEMDVLIDLVEMSKTRTRMNFALDARPKSIPARLMIQSLKLARQTMLKRFRKRVAEFAADIEARAKSQSL
ncbi:MAG: SRPBCC family protein [Maritimibacter sp.]|nr:SRPBCC family protein [Maritimibacter sp.]